MTELLEQPYFNPLFFLDLDFPFLYVYKTTVYNTWFIIFLLSIALMVFRFFLFNATTNLVRYLIIYGVRSFMDLTIQTLGRFYYYHFSFILSLFIFILCCNCSSCIPWTTEPTQDINTTLALGLIAFFYKDIQAIRTNGFRVYIKEFLQPFFIMFPINVIGHFSKIISISFRLFGNIFGGAIIMELYKAFISSSIIWQILGLISGFNFLILLFFGIFEGLIQAFVFSMLSLTYLALALHKEEPAGET